MKLHLFVRGAQPVRNRWAAGAFKLSGFFFIPILSLEEQSKPNICIKSRELYVIGAPKVPPTVFSSRRVSGKSEGRTPAIDPSLLLWQRRRRSRRRPLFSILKSGFNLAHSSGAVVNNSEPFFCDGISPINKLALAMSVVGL